MAKFIVQGGYGITGEISVRGSKNAAFPVIAACLLTDETCEITNVPDIVDIRNFLAILKKLGGEANFKNQKITINCKGVRSHVLPKEFYSKLRGSLLFAGPLLARMGKVNLPSPGGDAIGERPIDVHLNGLAKLGAKISEKGKEVRITGKILRGAEIIPGVTSVTGTENLVLASVLARGKTFIRLAAAEPHVQTLCRFLISMGAKIKGVGTPNLEITGVKKLKGKKIGLNPDEIEAMTFAVAAAASRSELLIKKIDRSHLRAPLAALERMNVKFEATDDTLFIKKSREPYRGTRIITGVYPQLLTDEQPLLGILATQARGKTSIHDWIYEGRQGYLRALQKMGARVEYDDVHRARVYGPSNLHGARIKTPDLRAGAAILIAALIARGKSTVYNAEIIDRGYERLDERLRGLGARIERIE